MSGSILIVGHDADTNRILEFWLHHLGYSVSALRDANRVVEIARSIRPKLVITNYPTRLAGGATVAETIRATPELAQTRILNVTSHVFPTELAAAVAAGVDRSLPMPAPLDVIAEEIARLIGPPHG